MKGYNTHYQAIITTTMGLPYAANYAPNIQEKINGATIVASLSTINLRVSASNLPQVIFSLDTAPEYEPEELVKRIRIFSFLRTS